MMEAVLHPVSGPSGVTDITAVHGDRPERPADPVTDQLLADLIAARATGRSGAVEQVESALITHHLPVAARIARRYARRGAPVEDLEQQARLGLVQAVRRWEPDHAPSFLAYAVPTMEGSVKRWFRDCLTLVRRPRSTQDASPLVRRTREELAHTTGREPSAQEIADRSGLPVAQVLECERAGTVCNPTSLDQQLLPDALVGTRDQALDRVELRSDLAGAWTALTPRERRVLALHYWEDMSQAAVGAVIGVSQMQVSRILSKAVSKLSAELAAA
jgi:RNA polymerase sigma-B factor